MTEGIGIKIGLDGVPGVTAGLKQIGGGLGTVGTQAATLGTALTRLAPQLAAAFTVGSFVAFARGAAQAIDELNDAADATGASIEELSKLDTVIRQTGGSFSTAASALVKFNQVLRDAKPGSAQADALRAIGLEAENLQRLDPAVALRETATALSRFADDANKARLVQELFGKSVREVAPFLKDLADAGDTVANVTVQQAAEIDKLNKALTRLGADASNVGRELLLELAPALSEVADRMRAARETFGSLTAALRQNIGAAQFRDAAEGAKFYGQEVSRLTAVVEKLGRGGSIFDRINLGSRREDLAEAQRLLQFYERVLQLQGRQQLDFGPPVLPPSINLPAGIDPKKAADAARASEAAARAAQRAAEGYARFTAELDKAIRLQEEELALGAPISAARRIQIEGYQRLAEVAASLTLQQRLQLRAQIEAQAAGAAQLAQQQAEARIIEKLADDRAKYLEQLTRSVDASRSAADAAADELIGLVAGAAALEELRTARLEDAAAELERKAAIESGDPYGNGGAAAQYRAEAEQLRRLAAIRRRAATATADAEVQAANDKAAQDAADAWQRTADQIGQSLTDAIIQGGLSGRDALERAFKTLVLRPFVDAAVHPLAQSITGGLSGLLGGGGLLGSLGGIGGAAGFAGSFGTFGSLFNAGAALTGTGISGTLGALSGAGSLLGQGQIVNGLGLGAGALGPYAAAAAVIYSIAKSFDKSGTPSTGSVVSIDALGRASTGGADPTNILRNFNPQTDTALRSLGSGAVNLLNALGGGGFSAQTKFTADGVDPSFGAFALSRNGQQVGAIPFSGAPDAKAYSSNREQAFEAFATDVAKAVRGAIDQIDLPGWAREQIDALGEGASLDQLAAVAEAIKRTTAQFDAFRDSLDGFGGVFAQIAGLNTEGLAGLVESAGGLDRLSSNLGTFFEEFYSEGERAAMQTSAVTAALAEVGLALPKTRDEFRALVEQQAALGVAGQPALAALLGVADAFASLTPEAVETAKEIDKLSERLRDAIANALPKFETDDQTTARRFREIQSSLASAGYDVSIDTLIGVSKDQVFEAAQAFLSAGGATEEAKLAIVEAASALADLKDAAADVAREAADAAEQLAQEAAAQRKASEDRLRSSIDSVLDRVLTPAQFSDFQYSRISDNLAGAGVNIGADVLRGADEQAVIDFARAFVLASDTSLDAKAAVVEAASALLALKDSAAELARIDAIKAVELQLNGIRDAIGDVSVIDTTERLSDAYRRNVSEAESLERSLDSLLGTAAQTIQETLSDLISTQRSLQGFRTGSLADSITDARLRSLSPTDRISLLRQQEAQLFGRLQTDADPVAVAQRLQGVILQRIRDEVTLREQGGAEILRLTEAARDAQVKALREQISGAERLRNLARDAGLLSQQLRFGDLSPLSYGDQLATARSLFDNTLAGARSGDEFAQRNLLGVARDYLQEARDSFASSAQFAGIFADVTTALDALGLQAQGLDPQLTVMQQQLDALQGVQQSIDTSQQTAGDELQALLSIDSALAQRDTALADSISQQTALAREQINELKAIVAEQRAQIAQAAEATKRLEAQLKELNDSASRTVGLLRNAEDAPTVRIGVGARER